MKKRFAWTATVAVLALTAGAALSPAQAAAEASGAGTTAGAAGTSAASAAQDVSPQQLEELVAQLPAMREFAAAARVRLGLEDSPLREAALQAIDPTQYECSSAVPPVVQAVTAGIESWTLEQRIVALYVQLFDIVMVDAVYLPQVGPSTFGAEGDFTLRTTHTYRDLRRFWDIRSDDIQLVPAHGKMLLDRSRVTRVFTLLYGLPEAVSATTADFIATVTNSAALRYGDHPIFTFNAYAYSGEGEEIPGVGAVPDKIVLGDGVLDGFASVGLGDVTPQAILAHEFGHHIQYEQGLFDSPLTGPEATRRTELMADAFGSYFLTHARGATMQWKRVQLFGQTFYQVGDCGFTANGHHGTPNQRLRTALWAYGVANDARPEGHILPSLTFAEKFEQGLPQLVAPDAVS